MFISNLSIKWLLLQRTVETSVFLFIHLIKIFFHTHPHTHTQTHHHHQPVASIHLSFTMFLIMNWTKQVPNNQHVLSSCCITKRTKWSWGTIKWSQHGGRGRNSEEEKTQRLTKRKKERWLREKSMETNSSWQVRGSIYYVRHVSADE